MDGKYFDDLQVGDKFGTTGRTVTETDIINFVTLAGFLEELFVNIEYIRTQSVFRQRVSHGLLTLSIAEGLVAQSHIFRGTALALLGLDQIRIPTPVVCGDTITVEIEIADKKETTKNDRGIIVTRQMVRNQKGELVMHFDATRLIRRRVNKEG